tara:strand:- start:9963 stop:10910 length:948 start_codon:yes stop_codon:yes gene_type:complete
MAFANASEYLIGIKTIIAYFKKESPKRSDTKCYRQSINWSRRVYFIGNAFKINVFLDYRWAGKGKHLSESDAIIDVKKQTLTINNLCLLEAGSDVFGRHFHNNVPISNHWSAIYGWRTEYEMKAEGFVELKSEHSPEIKVCWSGMKICLDTYKILNKPPKSELKNAEKWFEVTRLSRNASARSRRANNNAEVRLRNYENTKNKDDLDKKDVFRLFNVSLRRVVIDAFGMDNILAECNQKVLNENVIDGRPYKVVSVEIEDKAAHNKVRWCNYLQMVNPSTKEIHFEGIPNDNNTVLEALAWRDGEKEYIKPIALT